MEHIIDIKGMHCNSCVKLIESRIGSLKGVEKIKVSLAENKAFVQFNPEIVSLDKIRSEMHTLGYSTPLEEKANNEQALKQTPDLEDKIDNAEINNKKSRNLLQGIAYGIIPHIGCIAFIIGSVFGVTALMQYFKPLLMNPYFFHILVLISLGFATVSSVFYLKRNNLLSTAGLKRKWKYLTTMYGSTIAVNLLLFMLIFPLLANVSLASQPVTPITGAFAASTNNDDLSSIRLSVDIPCSGHAPLISQELKTINGVTSVQFSFPNIFDVKYDSTKTTKDQIIALDVFKTYKATVLESSSANQNGQVTSQQTSSQVNAGGGCCGGASCGCGG